MKLIKYSEIVASYYESQNKNWSLIIIALWAPNLEDIDNLRYRDLYLAAGYDILVPEYYWYCRSGGSFTPENSIQTLLDTKNTFNSGCVRDIFLDEIIQMKYKKIYFIWMSYGAWVVALLPKYDRSITDIALIYPVLSYETLWKTWVTEESAQDFKSIIQKWYSQVYRWIELPIWEEHFLDKTEYIPEKNINYLQWVNIFVSHWMDDNIINYKRTKQYYKNIKKIFPQNNILYKQYLWWHDDLVLKKSIIDIIDFFRK